MFKHLSKTNLPLKIFIAHASKFHRSAFARVPIYNFSDNKDKIPKGFEKFQRKVNKKVTETKEENNNEEKPSGQKIEIQKDEAETSKTTQENSTNEKNQKVKEKEEKIKKDNEEDINKEEDKKAKKKSDFGFSFGKDGFDKNFFDPKQMPKISLGKLLFIGTAFAFMFQIIQDSFEEVPLSYTDFVKNYLETDKIKKIVVKKMPNRNNSKITADIHTTNNEIKTLLLGNVDHFLENLEKFQLERGKTPDRLIPVEFQYIRDTEKTIERALSFLSYSLSIFLIYFLYKSLKGSMNTMGKGGGSDIFGFGKSQVKIYGLDTQIKTRFKDVAGLDEAKTEITEFVDFLKKPKKYKEMGAKIPRGALLAGPPGTGKTLLAKAAAGEAGVPFLYMSGSDFVEMFVGVGASRVRDLFKQAKNHSPSIIFIDEIDAVGRKRESKAGGNDERDSTLNQLLVEMDGFGTDTNVVVLAATNRKELLDNALTRPGRFDRTIEIGLPDLEGRKNIFMVHLKPLKLDLSKTMEEYANRLATLSPGFSGADIANLCNEAAILAARKNLKCVSSVEFEAAAERVIAGLEKKSIISEEERKTVAIHESGHAVVGWFLEGGHPLLKLTIIPRSKGSLGFAQYLPNESSLETKEELLDRLCSILGGRCSEELFNGKITTGAYDDLQKAYKIAHALVTKFGMSDRIGFIGFSEDEYIKKYSEATNRLIDEEIKRIIDECTEKTRALIKQHKEKIEKLYTRLLEKETLDLKEITEILGDRPFAPKAAFKAYLEIKKKQDEPEKTENKEEEKKTEISEDNNNENPPKGQEPQEVKSIQVLSALYAGNFLLTFWNM